MTIRVPANSLGSMRLVLGAITASAPRLDSTARTKELLTLVGNQGAEAQILDQSLGAIDAGHLVSAEDQALQIAQGIDGKVQPGALSAARAPECLATFFRALAAAGGYEQPRSR